MSRASCNRHFSSSTRREGRRSLDRQHLHNVYILVIYVYIYIEPLILPRLSAVTGWGQDRRIQVDELEALNRDNSFPWHTKRMLKSKGFRLRDLGFIVFKAGA